MLFTTTLLRLFKKESRLYFELEMVLFFFSKKCFQTLRPISNRHVLFIITKSLSNAKRTFVAAKVYNCALPKKKDYIETEGIKDNTTSLTVCGVLIQRTK